jgi:hypothetical protein
MQMKALFVWAAMALLVLAEAGWFFWPRMSSLGRGDYRISERSTAYNNYAQNPSSNNWAEVEKELELAARHDANKRMTVFSVLLTIDIPICVLIVRLNKPKLKL